MTKLVAYFFILIFCLQCGNALAQKKGEVETLYELAKQAKENEEYSKAIEYFEDLLDKTNSDTYYNELYILYTDLSDFESAEKLVKKRVRKFPKRAELLIDYGNVFDLQNEERNAEKYYKKAIEEVEQDDRQTRIVANQFLKYKRYNFAEQTYLQARKSLNNDRKYQFELANAYAYQGKTTEMVEEYLTILGGNRSYLQTVQNLLQRVLNPDPNGTEKEKLKDQLLRRIQKNPEQEVYSELLVWLFIQDKNFNGAFIQAKALDRKLNENGSRIYSLGQLSLANKDYSAAEKCFEYIINQGKENPYFQNAKMKLVETLQDKVVSNNNYTQEDLKKLELAYEKTIEELGKNYLTFSLLTGLADLNAYYLDSVAAGIDILSEVIQLPGIKKQDKAEAKISLADLFLLSNEIWEASLLYSQVEKEFKYDRIGEIAKFKNAKVAFYTGDFYWAQAQLDVLKGSTSKLISNDAMDLSLLITDNVGRDSIVEPLEMFAVADLMIFKKDYSKALVVMDSITKYFPATSLKDDILFTKYKIAYKKRDYELAKVHLKMVLADYAEDLLGDDALFALAKLEEEELGNKAEAMELYKTLLTTYPASLFVVEARKRFRALRGDKLDEEL